MNPVIIISFTDLDELEAVLDEIFKQSLFGDNLLDLSEFMIEPERVINEYFSNKDITEYTVFEFEYTPSKSIRPCEKTVFEFQFNVN